MGRRLKSADEFAATQGERRSRIEARFEEEFWALWDATEVIIPWELSDAWEKLPQKEATEREFDYVAGILAKKILAGEVEVPSPKKFAEWARRLLANHSEAPKASAPQGRDARSERIAEQYRLLAEHEEERKRNGTYRPLESFRAVRTWMKRDPAGYERYRAMVGPR